MSAPDPSTHSDRDPAAQALFLALHARLRSKERRPTLGTSDDAVWVTWRVEGHAPLEFRIVDPRWSQADPDELADRLFAGIREELRRHQEAHGTGA